MPDFRAALLVLLFSLLSVSANAYVTTIHAPAVLTNENIGNLTVFQLNVTPGNGAVTVGGPASVDADTLASAQTAATYASSFLNLNEKDYNFNYTIEDKNMSVSGPSGGLAFTLLAVAALQHRQLAQNFTVTGTIEGNGSVGLIGGVTDKAQAASAGGMKFILVPYAPMSSFEYLLYYISQQRSGLPMAMATNVSQALQYAFSGQTPQLLSINLTQKYNISAAGTSNITCTNCNTSAFDQLVNLTLNFTSSTISSIGSNFSLAKQQLAGNINDYGTLAAHGYLYTAADLSFLNFITAYTLANVQNYTPTGASGLLSNVSSFCSSLTPPPLTNQNYEFVFGGRLRQYWANYTLTSARQTLSSEQSTDDIVQSIYTAASAMGWCEASSQLYNTAASMGGAYVQTSASLRNSAASAINRARAVSSGMYLQTAVQAYNDGDYATALYSATYANTFSQQAPNVSASQLYPEILANIANATTGTWPSQFAAQSEFYFRQSLVSSGANVTADAQEAYSTSLLAANLAADNKIINASFVASSQASGLSQQAEQQITNIEQSITQIYALLLVNAVLLFIVLVVLLVHMLPRGKRASLRKR